MCPHEEKLTAWLLGDLSPAEQEAMTRHVDGCGACRAAGEELSRVLAPLRSGLAKDRSWQPGIRAALPARRPSLWIRLWSSPHEGLKRAALLAVSFGTLFALISALYQSSQREATPACAVTTIEFKRLDADAATPLEPLAAPLKGETAEDRLDRESEHKPAALDVESRPVPYPKPPAAEPRMPALRRLAAQSETESMPAAPAAEAAAAEPAPRPQAAAKAAPKRERAKSFAVSRPPADLQMKAALLGGAKPAVTNAVSTNAVPTNAVAPKVKNAP